MKKLLLVMLLALGVGTVLKAQAPSNWVIIPVAFEIDQQAVTAQVGSDHSIVGNTAITTEGENLVYVVLDNPGTTTATFRIYVQNLRVWGTQGIGYLELIESSATSTTGENTSISIKIISNTCIATIQNPLPTANYHIRLKVTPWW